VSSHRCDASRSIVSAPGGTRSQGETNQVRPEHTVFQRVPQPCTLVPASSQGRKRTCELTVGFEDESAGPDRPRAAPWAGFG
jgi:hypothetical protein